MTPDHALTKRRFLCGRRRSLPASMCISRLAPSGPTTVPGPWPHNHVLHVAAGTARGRGCGARIQRADRGDREWQRLVRLITNSPTLVRGIHQLYCERGLHPLDTPVRGGPQGAKSGRLVTTVASSATNGIVWSRSSCSLADLSAADPPAGPQNQRMPYLNMSEAAIGAPCHHRLLYENGLFSLPLPALRIGERAQIRNQCLLHACDHGGDRVVISSVHYCVNCILVRRYWFLRSVLITEYQR